MVGGISRKRRRAAAIDADRGELCDFPKDLLLELGAADFTKLKKEVADMSLKFAEQRSKDVSD